MGSSTSFSRVPTLSDSTTRGTRFEMSFLLALIALTEAAGGGVNIYLDAIGIASRGSYNNTDSMSDGAIDFVSSRHQ
jgi:hypothetical protein